MKRGILVSFLLLWCLLTGALPAYANNPPAPAGMLSLILIFPVGILGFRLAGAELTDEEKQKKWRITNGIILGFATLCAMTGTGISAAGLLVLLGYGVLRAVQVMRRGRGGRRFAVGAAVNPFYPVREPELPRIDQRGPHGQKHGIWRRERRADNRER